MVNLNWTCPHCARPQVATDENQHRASVYFHVTTLDIGDVGLDVDAVACLNEECKKLTLNAWLRRWANRHHGSLHYNLNTEIEHWRLVPSSSAIPQPDSIPAPLREDYYEACSIRDLSAKSSAALARRCLQGMIRDYCKIAKGTLDAEIKALNAAVDP
jgi:hypothetical protein